MRQILLALGNHLIRNFAEEPRHALTGAVAAHQSQYRLEGQEAASRPRTQRVQTRYTKLAPSVTAEQELAAS